MGGLLGSEPGVSWKLRHQLVEGFILDPAFPGQDAPLGRFDQIGLAPLVICQQMGQAVLSARKAFLGRRAKIIYRLWHF